MPLIYTNVRVLSLLCARTSSMCHSSSSRCNNVVPVALYNPHGKEAWHTPLTSGMPSLRTAPRSPTARSQANILSTEASPNYMAQRFKPNFFTC